MLICFCKHLLPTMLPFVCFLFPAFSAGTAISNMIPKFSLQGIAPEKSTCFKESTPLCFPNSTWICFEVSNKSKLCRSYLVEECIHASCLPGHVLPLQRFRLWTSEKIFLMGVQRSGDVCSLFAGGMVRNLGEDVPEEGFKGLMKLALQRQYPSPLSPRSWLYLPSCLSWTESFLTISIKRESFWRISTK